MNHKSIVKNFFDKLNAEGVEYCVLWGYNDLPDNVSGSDIDVYIKHECLHAVQKVAGGLGLNWKKHPQSLAHEQRYEAYTIGLSFDIYQGNIMMGPASDRRSYHMLRDLIEADGTVLSESGIRVPKPGVGMLLLLMRGFVDKEDLKDKYKKQIRLLADKL